MSEIGIDTLRQKLGTGSQHTARNHNKDKMLRVDSSHNIMHSKSRDNLQDQSNHDSSNPRRNSNYNLNQNEKNNSQINN